MIGRASQETIFSAPKSHHEVPEQKPWNAVHKQDRHMCDFEIC